MPKRFLTDEEVESEIARLKESEAVKLAKAEQRIKYKRRQALWQLRSFEKRGKELMALGINADNLEQMMEFEAEGMPD